MVKAISSTDIIKTLIDNCSWEKDELIECKSTISFCAQFLSNSQMKTVLQYYNLRAPQECKLVSINELKQNL